MGKEGLVKELEYTKDVLDAVVSLDKLGDSTNDEDALLLGFAKLLREKIPCKGIVLLMFNEKGDLKPKGVMGEVDFDVETCRNIAEDLR